MVHYYGFMPPSPPMWDNASAGDPNFYEQGVYSDLGNYPSGSGPQKMKLVGFGPSEGLGGTPLFEGRHGLVQCGQNPSTGEYMTDAKGQARCWTVPVSAGSFSRMGDAAYINPESDLIHYGSGIPAPFNAAPYGPNPMMYVKDPRAAFTGVPNTNLMKYGCDPATMFIGGLGLVSVAISLLPIALIAVLIVYFYKKSIGGS